MTAQEMAARIAELEAQLSPRRVRSVTNKAAHTKAAKELARARKRQFQIDRWRRERRHTSLSRYAII